jgi:hypothetical protein
VEALGAREVREVAAKPQRLPSLAAQDLTSLPTPVQDPPPVFGSGFHRLGYFFGLVSVAVWTYVFNEWWGGDWWGLLLAIAAAIPVGLVFSILPSILLETLRRLPFLNDALLTWLFIPGGIALGLYALIAFEGTVLAMVALTGVETSAGGIGLRSRMNAVR